MSDPKQDNLAKLKREHDSITDLWLAARKKLRAAEREFRGVERDRDYTKRMIRQAERELGIER